MKSLYFTFLLSLLCLAVTAQPVVLNDPAKVYHIFQNCVALEVKPQQKITIDSLLLHPEKYPFAPLRQKTLQPNGNSFYWLKVNLTNPTPDNYFLRFLHLGDMFYQGFEVDRNRLISSWQVGLLGVATSNLFQRSRGIIPLQLRQGYTHTLFLLVHQNGIPTLHVAAMSSQKLVEDTHYQDLFYGLYYGFIFIIATYSLLLGIRLHDRDNVLYALVTVMSGLNLSITYGAPLELAGNWIIIVKENYGVCLGISIIVSALFTISFLQLRQRARWLYWVGVALVILYATGTLSTLGAYLTGFKKPQYYLALLVAFSGLLFHLLAGVIISFKRYVPAIFFTFGQFSVLIGSAFFTLSQNGFLPFTFLGA